MLLNNQPINQSTFLLCRFAFGFALFRFRREHALEMGGNPDKDPPFFFTKPPDAAVDVSAEGAVVPFPTETQDLQHEVEMVVAIGKGAVVGGSPKRHTAVLLLY